MPTFYPSWAAGAHNINPALTYSYRDSTGVNSGATTGPTYITATTWGQVTESSSNSGTFIGNNVSLTFTVNSLNASVATNPVVINILNQISGLTFTPTSCNATTTTPCTIAVIADSSFPSGAIVLQWSATPTGGAATVPQTALINLTK